jgi:hypothetical protein
MRDLLRETADYAADFLESLPERPVSPPVDLEALRARMGGPVPGEPTDPHEVGGIAELIERCCDHAARFAGEIATVPGAEVLNEVVLNQVLFRFESDERTLATFRAAAA